MTSPLSIQSVTKRFGAQVALDAVSFDLKPGEIFGLIGLNGAGKTTLIKILLDLHRADSGEVTLFGQSTDDAAARRHLVYLPEKFQPSRYLKGYEYLDLSLAYYGLNPDHAGADALARALDLDVGKLKAQVKGYSKGMGQKLGLIGAMLAARPMLVLDEPMSGLDPSARIKLKAALVAQRDAGRTVFFSSHILSDIDEICDRIGIIHHGKLLFVGTPTEFKTRHPAATLERSFLAAIGEGEAVAA